MNRTCEKCIHYEVCRYPLEWRAFPDTCWKYEEERPHGVWKEVCDFDGNHYKWECSVCGRLEEFEDDFCNCGADMRKEGDEE